MKRLECDHCRGASHTRRDFLRAGTLSFLGIGLSDFLRLGSAQALAAVEGAAAPGPRLRRSSWSGWMVGSAISTVGM